MSKEQSSFDLSYLNPLPHLKNAFKKSTQDYNLILQLQKKVLESRQVQLQEGIIVPGIKNAFINRYEGIKGAKNLPHRAKEGLFWMTYYLLTPQIVLQEHVGKAIQNWAWYKMTGKGGMDMVTGVVSGIVTGVVTTTMMDKRDIVSITNTSKEMAEHRLKTLAVSTMFGIGVSMFLKQMAQTSKTEIRRQLLTGTRRAWRVGGFFAVLHGLGCIDDAMNDEEVRPFTESLRKDRDKTREQMWKEWETEWRILVPNQSQQKQFLALMNQPKID